MIMGLGQWRNRVGWPLPLLRVAKQRTRSLWREVGQNPMRVLIKILMSWSWSSVEVLRLFDTSKLWYMASAFPLPAKKFEAGMFCFLWMGKFDELQIDEISKTSISTLFGH